MLTPEQWQRRSERERNARKQAERLLEGKSRELFDANQALIRAAETLEAQVVDRTAELSAAVQAAEQANSAKSRFLAKVSHELRTPLNGVISMIALAQDGDIDTSAAEYLGHAARSSKHLLTIINDLLDLSRLAEGKVTPQVEAFDLAELLDELHAVSKLAAEKKGLSLRTNVSRQAGMESADLCVGDPLRIRQILENLVTNAIKFTASGDVSVSAHLGKDQVKLTVQDTGIGMNPEQLPRLFTPFEQAEDSYARAQEGTGLGLAIVKELSELLGGGVIAASTPGTGSRFTVTLPMTFECNPARMVNPSKKLSAPYQVLVVDDSMTNRLSIKLLLERAGWQVDTANDGVEALEKAAAQQKLPTQFDAVLMDVSMPRMDGIEALQHLRADGLVDATCPVIALTAHAMPEVAKELRDAGMNGLLSKPVDPTSIHLEIAALIETAAST